ncbi:MAG: DnaB-like helicase N-terminal domain-containing protein, partial [Gallionella sp.]|nr:DnaB-like helicase N-terminal domain-containing protein [Gallionella sp.]
MAGEAARVVQLGSERLPRGVDKAPHSSQAEQALLGAIMVNNRFYDELGGALKAEHFYVPLHGAVFEAIDSIINERGGEANPITISQRLHGTPYDAEKALFPHLTAMFENAAL